MNIGCAYVGPIGTPVATDNCSISSITNNAPSSYPVGTTTVTWTISDVSGNTTTCTQLVVVSDNSAPTITCPPSVTSYPNFGCLYFGSIGNPIVSDNCSLASLSNNAPFIYNAGITTVVWTVSDVNGNTSSCSQLITVIDNVLPTISCPPTANVFANSGCGYVGSIGTPVTSDNCSVASVTNNAPATFPIGSTVVTWTVTDNAGNTASCNQLVIVTDNTAPVITCPATQTLNLNASCSATVPNYTSMAIATDNCSVVSITQSPAAGAVVSGTGSFTVTLTATDPYGNVSTCSFTVNKVDVIPPTIVCPGTQTLSLSTSCSAVLPNYTAMANITNNCGTVTVTQSPAAGTSVTGNGIMVVTLTATDASG
ncbi:MAG: HYR domain-containing protein, partial [Flavobacteriales bacterium]